MQMIVSADRALKMAGAWSADSWCSETEVERGRSVELNRREPSPDGHVSPFSARSLRSEAMASARVLNTREFALALLTMPLVR